MKIKKISLGLLMSLSIFTVLAAVGAIPPIDRLATTLSGIFKDPLEINGPGVGQLQYQEDEVLTGAVGWVSNESGKGVGDGDIPAHNWVDAKGNTVAKYGTNVGVMVKGYFVTTFSSDHGYLSGGFLVYDVSNPRDIRLVRRIYDVQADTSNRITGGLTSEFREAHSIGTAVIKDKEGKERTYVVVPSRFGVEFWDFSDVNDIRQVSKLRVPNVDGGNYSGVVWQMSWQAPFLYMATGAGGIYIADTTDVENPKLLKRGNRDVVIDAGFDVGPLFVMGNHLVVTSMNNEAPWRSYDISDPFGPVLLADTNVPQQEKKYYSSCFDGENVYASAYDNGGRMYGFNLSDPGNFLEIPYRAWVPIQLYCATQDGYVFQGAQYKLHKVKVRDDAGKLIQFTDIKSGSLHPIFPQKFSKSVSNDLNNLNLDAGDLSFENAASQDVEKWARRGLLHPLALKDAGGKFNLTSRKWEFAAGVNSSKLLNRSGGEYSRTTHADHGQVTPLGNILYIGDDHGMGSGFMVHQAAPDTLAPQIREVSPRRDATDQKVTSRIGIAMTDSILLESVNASTFQVRNKSSGQHVQGTYSVQLGLINFAPKEPLLENTEYEVTVKGVQDIAKNASSEFKYTFTTGLRSNSEVFSAEHHWPLMNTLKDLSGGANLVMSGNLKPAYDTTNGAIKLSKTDITRVMNISNDKVGEKLAGTSSVSLYFKITAGFTGSDKAWEAPGFLGRDSAGNQNDVFWGYINSTGRLVLQHGDNFKITTSSAVNDDKWRHLVMTRNADTGVMRMMIDGQTVGSLVGPKGLVAALPQVVGAITGNTASTAYLDGSMAELRVFSKELTEQEALSINQKGLMSVTVSNSPTVGNSVSFTPNVIVPSGGSGNYSWSFGDGSALKNGLRASHAYTSPGQYKATLTLDGVPVAYVDVTVLDKVPTAIAPTHTTNITGNGSMVFAVNPDSGTVSAIRSGVALAELKTEWEVPVGKSPKTLAVGPDGNIWVAVQADDKLVVLEPSTGALLKKITLPYGSGPHGIVFAPQGGSGLVSLESKSTLLRINSSQNGEISLTPENSKQIGSGLRGVAISHDARFAYVTRFKSTNTGAEVYQVGLNSGILADAPLQTVVIATDTTTSRAEDRSPGVANYLHQVVIAPNGLSAIVPSKKDNVVSNLGLDSLLDPETTVRSILTRISLSDVTPKATQYLDFNNSAPARAAIFSPDGSKLFVAQMEGNSIAVVDLFSRATRTINSAGKAVTAPHGLYLDKVTQRLFVNNFLDRSVGVYDVAETLKSGSVTAMQLPLAKVSTVAVEPLNAEVLSGKKIFYNAADSRMSLNKYMSCASCHTDGGDDGVTWNFAGRGQGLRSTPTLSGRSGTGHGNVHWTANFDEIQDFENDIRRFFGGSGFLNQADWDNTETQKPLGTNKKAKLSTDLDNLAKYVQSLNEYPRSPERNGDGTLSASSLNGSRVFKEMNCASCHSGATKQDNVLHKSSVTNGKSPNDEAFQKGIDTPSLIGVWATAPYFHDGRAAALIDVFNEGHGLPQGVKLSSQEAQDLANYLRSFDHESSNFWTFKSDTSDLTGTTPGTLSGATTGAGPIWIDGGLDFGRLSAGVDLGNDNVAKTLADTSSMSFTIKTTQVGNDTMWRAPGVFGWEQVGGSADIFWGWIDAAGRIGFTVGDETPIKSLTPINNNQWHHIVLTRNAANGKIAMYVNGVLASERTVASKLGAIPNATSRKLGLIINNTGAPRFNGVLKNVSVYDSVLKESDVKNLFSAALQ